ncbi:UNVERIFIED_CONTAM: Nuclear envelope morphology protein 1 [Siphonaria sp. JEL0065]|nr:Nuclear envelope morphology protein 1 [Siphonaria sp. JEL0065]
MSSLITSAQQQQRQLDIRRRVSVASNHGHGLLSKGSVNSLASTSSTSSASTTSTTSTTSPAIAYSSSEYDFTTTDADTDLEPSKNREKKKKRFKRVKEVELPKKTSLLGLLWPPNWFQTTQNNPTKQRKSTSALLRQKKTLVLDLDETLVHSTSMGSRHHDHIIEVLVDKHVCLYYVYKRPGVDAFLKKVSEWYKVVIFTASMSEYADPVIDWLDKDRTLISRRYFRQHCTMHENGHFTKDLSIVEADLRSVVLLDNSAVSFALNPGE